MTCDRTNQTSTDGASRWSLRRAALGAGQWLTCRSTAFWLSAAVALAFAASNLTFSLGLDDTVLEWTTRPLEHQLDAGGMLRKFESNFIPPAATPDSTSIFRPLRAALTCLLGFTALISPVIPDLLSGLMTGLCAYLLIRFHRVAGLPESVSNWSALWFFGCIPVVAMGQVTFVSQFVMIGAMYGALALFEKFSTTRQMRWLLGSACIFFVGGLYGEAMIIPAVAIGCLSMVRLCQRRFRASGEALGFCLCGLALVLGNGFFLSGDPAQISRGLRSVLNSRSSSLDFGGQGDLFHRLWRVIAGYRDAFRRETITSIIFSLSPLLCLVVVGAFIYNGLAKRKYLGPLIMVGLVVLACCGLPAWVASRTGEYQRDLRVLAVSGAFVLLYLTSARGYPLLGCMIAAGVAVLGPIFIIDTHIAYILPATAAVMFLVLREGLRALSARGRRTLAGAVVGLLAMIGVSNFAGGAYLCGSIVHDNDRLARELGEQLRHDVILTNFRHAFDLFAAVNAGRPRMQCERNMWFTATVPMFPETQAVRDERQLEQWLERARQRHRKVYFLVVDHDRLAHKAAYHGPRFLDDDHRFKLVKTHNFRASAWCFDPTYMLGDYLRRHHLANGFIGYPIFPDMIDDVGVEYTPFSRRIVACYRLLEVDPEDLGTAGPGEPASIVNENVLGYRITTENQFFVATPRHDAPALAHQGEIRSAKLDTVLREIRLRGGKPQEVFPAIRIAEGAGRGTTIFVCEGRYLGLPSEDSPFSLQRWRRGTYPRIVEAASMQLVKKALQEHVASSDSVALVGALRGVNIIRCGDRIFGLPQSAGAFDLQKALDHGYACCYQAASVEEVKRLVEAAAPQNANSASTAPDLTPRLQRSGVHGFNIIGCDHNFYGLPQASGAFDLDKVRAHGYPVCFEGTSVEQVMRSIEDSLGPAVGHKSNHTHTTK